MARGAQTSPFHFPRFEAGPGRFLRRFSVLHGVVAPRRIGLRKVNLFSYAISLFFS